MTTVFLDTVGLLALWDEANQWHGAAERSFQEISQRRDELITTSFIFNECGNAAARRPYRNRVNQLRRALELREEVITPSDEDLAVAWEAYDRGEAGQAGIVDHVSFAVMRRLEIVQAFTNDQHFSAAGFVTLFEGSTSGAPPPEPWRPNELTSLAGVLNR